MEDDKRGRYSIPPASRPSNEDIMENALRIFNYQGTEIRTIVIDGEVYFVAFDVCRFLELKNVSQAVSRLKEKHKGDIIISDVTGRLQSMLCVKEPGLYQLIFTSRKPEAEAFQDWVYEEVLPAIRKTGSYSIPEQSLPRLMINSVWERRRVLFNLNTKIPDAYWCIFDEVAGYLSKLEEYRNIHLVESATPDIAVGLHWMPEVRRLGLDVSLIRRYPHVYPDKRGKQMANIYPNDWLGTFRTWFQIDYLRHEFPIYLSTRLLALPEGQADQRRLSDGG